MFFQPVGNLKQSLGLYLSDGLIEILAGFAVERAEQFAVPVDEKFINGRTFVSIRFTTYFLEVFENIWDKIWRN